MTAINVRDLILLAALWGASFLFMRMGAGEFGPIPLIELRVGIAALFLLPMLSWRRDLPILRENGLALLIVGATNSALPFCLIAYSMLYVTAGFASILNATAPMFGAIIAFIWYQQRMTLFQLAGLSIGFAGVVLLVWGRASFNLAGDSILGDETIAIAAGLVAALFYGIAANYSKSRLSAVSPLVNATGSQVGAALLLLPFALLTWPQQSPPLMSWLAVIVLGVACTGIAYLLYFRLIASAGPQKAIAVTYLVPAFGMVWGAFFLEETITLEMILACAVILLGTALTTGMLKPQALRLIWGR
ncbi:DMT family transporter [Motiliproteus sp. MSK22-1]|uniref:DMT family transporter n=1 Tax=Motiliproteus sp. MSK22-1 TaxID=1897630 RepID=UPI00097649AB|nr:DMT family transporter [Motiliproteus sp. MSK22-1]OMH27969.1 hypothetical protein BGP75_21565 [Motiliproteus sp. MSK22-1]